MAIDSYRFLDFATRQIMKARAARLEPGVIPPALRARMTGRPIGWRVRLAAAHYSIVGPHPRAQGTPRSDGAGVDVGHVCMRLFIKLAGGLPT